MIEDNLNAMGEDEENQEDDKEEEDKEDNKVVNYETFESSSEDEFS